MTTDSAKPDEPFQTRQLGMRQLLGAMTVMAIAMAVAAARIRTLSPVEGAQVARSAVETVLDKVRSRAKG